MKSELVVAFGAGICIAGPVGYYIAYHKLKKEKDQAIDDIRQHFIKKEKEAEKKAKSAEKWEEIKAETKKSAEENIEKNKRYAADKGDITKYYNVVKESGYVPANAPIRPQVPTEKTIETQDMEIIPPEKYAEIEEYDKITFQYYSNDILADENDEIIDYPEDFVPEDFAMHFGEFEPDSVNVVNHVTKAYYEILLAGRDYPIEGEGRPKRVEVRTE